MPSFNRGEWSELYALLSLLVKPKLNLVDASLVKITDEIFILESIIIEDDKKDIEYKLVESDIHLFHNKSKVDSIPISEFIDNKNKLLLAIKNASASSGSFEVESINDFVLRITKRGKFKSNSSNKKDISLRVKDIKKSLNAILGYSIKSSLGSPATILNASKSTDFIFRVKNIPASAIKSINEINTREKLKDRINKIYSYENAKIEFVKVPDTNFEYNLKMIDSNMNLYLANALLASYMLDSKKISNLFIQSNNFTDEQMANKKLGDLLEAISFGFFPSKKWDGIKSINGGLIIVKKDAEVVILDLIYYREQVVKYLIEQTKLDSPSSTRYNMLSLYEENGEILFTLNLQIRYV